MLTFFDYLRRRAFESIVAGVHDALSSLENEEIPSDLAVATNALEKNKSRNSESNASDADKLAKPPLEASQKSSESLPPPRRRGRPPKKKKPS